jgi:hypothetical protein
MGVRPVDEVAVRLRIDVGEDRSTVYIDVDLAGRTVSLTRGAAAVLAAELHDRLDAAARFEAAEQNRRLPPPNGG